MKKNLLKWGVLSIFCALTSMAGAQTITQEDLTFLPENGSTLESLNEVMVEYQSGISLSSTAVASDITITSESGATSSATSCIAEVENESYVINFTMLNTVGTYTITIPSCFFLLGDDNVESPEITLTYTIDDGGEDIEYEFTLTPDYGDKVTSLSTITIQANAKLELNEDFAANYEDYGDDYDKVVVLDTSDQIVASASVANDNEWDPIDDEDDVRIGFIFKLNNTITEPGRYLYIIPAGYFCLGSLTNLSGQFSATVYVVEEDSDGISNVTLNTAGDSVYYNLNGQRVTAPNKGIYILNGKKLLVK